MMEEVRENVSLNSVGGKELNEEEEDADSAVSCKHVYAMWLKPCSVSELKFVSKDVLMIRVEKTLTFYNLNTHKDHVLLVGSKSIPVTGGNDDDLQLEGIGCADCCGTDLLALAEQPPISKVVICLYPDLKVLATLIDSSCAAGYKSILFLRLEYLIGLRDYPAFDLIVWAWRIGEKLFVVDTGFIQPNQYLNLSAATPPSGRNEVHLSQMELDVECKLQLWTLSMDCQTVYPQSTRVEVPPDVSGPGCWTPNGWYVFCDSSANVFRVQPGAREPQLVVAELISMEQTGSGPDESGNGGTGTRLLLSPAKQGFVLYSANHGNRVTYFKEDNNSVLTKSWTIVVDSVLHCIMVAVKNEVYGWSDEGALLQLTKEKQKILKVYGSKIKYFTFVKPTDEMVATINDKQFLQVWDTSTGKFISKMKLNGTATDLCSNPFYPYIAITFKNGKIELLRTVTNANKIECIATIVLCDEHLTSVKFFSDGNICCVTSFPTGQFFYIGITLGQKCSVLREHHLEKYVIDNDIVGNKKSSFLAVLYTDIKNAENVGNNILIFDIDFKIVFRLTDVHNYYTSVFKWTLCSVPDALNVAFTVFLSKCIHTMTIDIVKAEVLESQTIPLDHQSRSIKAFMCENHCVTFSPDGSYHIYEFDDEGQWKQMDMVNCSHWQSGGLIAAQADANVRNILTLSQLGNFMSTSFKGTYNRTRKIDKINFPMIEDNFKTQGIGFEDAPESPKRRTWKMINEENELNANKVAYSHEKEKKIQDLKKIKLELQNLLETNINGPEDQKIDIKEFDLNIDFRLSFKEKCKLERKEYEEKILSDIEIFKMETQNIIKEKWETLFIKPKSIYCFKKIYKVDNYPIDKLYEEIVEKGNKIIEERLLIRDHISESSSISPYFRNSLDIMDDKSTESNSFDDKISYYSLMVGSISHELVETINTLNSQLNYLQLEKAEEEIILLQFVVNKLKHAFNQLFDDLFVEKQRKLDSLKEYNDRLHVIESELRLACKIEITEPVPLGYEWNKYEQTEKLLNVSDDEVLVKLHENVKLAAKRLASTDKNNVGTAGKRDDSVSIFRLRALMTMMDGVLEKRWEDELKKDVPKPQCIVLNKNPNDFMPEDFKAIAEYEKLTLILNDERAKYKNILEEEKIRIYHHIERIVEQFDNLVLTLFQTRLKYNAAIDQENLKMLRITNILCSRNERKQKIKRHDEIILELRESIGQNVKVIAETNKKLVNEPNSLLNTLVTLNHKNTMLDTRFESEFPSKVMYKQALTTYNRRPMIQSSMNYSPILGYQFVNTVVYPPTDDKLHLLTSEFIKYLDTLRAYDEYKLNMDIETWHKICKYRRKKIESEFKISSLQKDINDKEDLMETLKRDNEDKEATIKKLEKLIAWLKYQDKNYEDETEVQIVMNLGEIEIKLTGHFSDFENNILTPISAIDEVNTRIKEMGNSKINTISNLLKFKRKCRFLKWKYEILQNHEIPLYKFRFDHITSIKITENMIKYLKFKMKGINIAEHAAHSEDKEIASIAFSFSKRKEKLYENLNLTYKMIKDTNKRNEKVDEDIGQMTREVTELKFHISNGLNDELMLHNGEKVKDIMKYTQINKKVVELFKEIEVLQLELGLQLHKTSPTLYTNFQKNTSISK